MESFTSHSTSIPCIRDVCLTIESPQRDVNVGRILYAIPRTLEGICIVTKAAVQIHRPENPEFFRTFSLRHGLIISDSDTSSESFEEFLAQGPDCTFNLVDINDIERESEHDLLHGVSFPSESFVDFSSRFYVCLP